MRKEHVTSAQFNKNYQVSELSLKQEGAFSWYSIQVTENITGYSTEWAYNSEWGTVEPWNPRGYKYAFPEALANHVSRIVRKNISKKVS